MEIAQERELQERQQAWWPLDTMACSSILDMSSSNSCFVFEWDPQLRYFGLGVAGVAAAGDPDDHHTHEHELELFFPKCMESPASSEASSAVTGTGVPTAQDAMVLPEDQLDELLRNFWDAEEEEQQLVGFNPSCIPKEKSTTTAFLDDGLLALSSASPAGPVKTVARPQPEQQPPPPSPSSSHCNVDPPASDAGGAQTTRTNCSSKRSTTSAEGTDAWSSKRSRTAASSGAGPSVVRPFTVVKPGGVDGVATLADINERILTRPARPVRHPVGEFACAPRASAGGSRPAPSGKAVTGFTRLHTAGRGTITIVRTRG